nr:hypothetical protein [Tanacetum cinerariifolium]
STPKNDRFDIKSYLLESLLNRDESIPSGIDCDNSNSVGDNLFLERLLHDDPIPLPDTFDFDFSNVVRVFLPFFTYPVTSAILLSSGSEDTIFDPDIFNYQFSSLEPGVSHRSRTSMKFNVYPNHLKPDDDSWKEHSYPGFVQYSRKLEDSCQRILSSKSSFPQLQLGIMYPNLIDQRFSFGIPYKWP